MYRLQTEADLPDDLWLVFRGRGDQLRLSPTVANDLLRQVEFADGGALEALRIRPLGRQSTVVIDPALHSGAPSVHDVRTARLAERVEDVLGLAGMLARAKLPVMAWSKSWLVHAR